MSNAGLRFRATRDLDIVLCIEALDREFGEAFWSFVHTAGYGQCEVAREGRRFYRFQNPSNDTYPEMLELFARTPDALVISVDSHLTPIPIGNDVSSLSAILLNDDYYRWIHDGRIELEGLPIVRAEHIIPLKARAWIDLRDRKKAGEKVDRRSIKKHKNDVFRLAQIVDPEYMASLPNTLDADMRKFVEEVALDRPDLKSLGIRTASFESLLDTVKSLYQLD
jgi:hypothetical protein